MSYRMSHVSPSALAATERCPRYRPDGQSNAAADEGTLLHAELEAMVAEPQRNWDAWIETRGLSAESKGLLQEAAASLRSIVPDGLAVAKDYKVRGPVPPGVYPECELETYPGHHGYIDLLVVPRAGTMTVIDYKFVRSEHDYELQLGAYAKALSEADPKFAVIEARVVAPRLEGESDSYMWTPETLQRVVARIRSVEENADDPFVPGNPGEDCCHCHWNGRCPFQAAAIKTSAPESAELARTGERVLLNPSTPEERALRRDLVSWLSAWLEAVKKDDSDWLDKHEGASLPGYSCSRCAGRMSLDKTRMNDAFKALMETFTLAPDDLQSFSAVDQKALVEFLMLRNGTSEKETKVQVAKALDRFMLRGAPYVRVVKLSGGRKTKSLPA